MRILLLSEQFPFPLHDGGNLRTYHILRALASEHEVWLVCHEPPCDFGDALRHVHRIVTVREPVVARRALGNLVRPGAWGVPAYVVKNWSKPLLRAADELLAHHAFDVIHLNMLDTACFAPARNWEQPKVFDTHNCLSAMAAGFSRHRRGIWRAIYAREARLLRKCERRVCRRMDLNLVCSADDAVQFREFAPEANVQVVPNGVDAEAFHPDPATPIEPGMLAYTGAMSYYPNEEAMLFFCRQVMPLLSDRSSSPKLYIVGKDPSERIRALHNGVSVVVTGKVADVRPIVRQAEVFVVPLRTGSGTRLKILEALALGKAIVSTSKGAEGIPVKHERELLIADSPEEFAAQIRRLLDSPALRDRLSAAGRAFVETEYDWRQIGKRLLAEYEILPKTPRPAESRLVAV